MEIRFKMLMNIESSFCWSVEGLSQMLFIGLWPGFNALRKGDGMLRQRRNLVLWLVRIALCLMLFNIDNVPNKQFLISIMHCFGLLRRYEVRVGRTWVMTPLRIMWVRHQASLANDIKSQHTSKTTMISFVSSTQSVLSVSVKVSIEQKLSIYMHVHDFQIESNLDKICQSVPLRAGARNKAGPQIFLHMVRQNVNSRCFSNWNMTRIYFPQIVQLTKLGK